MKHPRTDFRPGVLRVDGRIPDGLSILLGATDESGMAERRRALLARLTGEVIEVGAGDGLNFPYCPTAVTRVLAVEPEPRLRSLARIAAGRAPVPVEVVDGLAEQLPTGGAIADAVVVSLVLCSVRDQDPALWEILWGSFIHRCK